MAAALVPGSGVFDDVFFAIIPSDDLSTQQTNQLSASLEAGGATKLDLDSTDLQHITHLISTHTTFSAYHDAVDGFIHVVKPSWVEQSLLKGKASNPRQFSPDPRFFFSDIVIHIAEDIPDGDKEAITAGVHAMGGQSSPRMTKLVTHVIAMTNANAQYKLIVDKNLKSLPVLPHWFDDCLKLGKKIDPSPYIIPKEGLPSLFTERASDPILSQSTPDPFSRIRTPPMSPSKPRQDLNVLKRKRVMLHQDLDLSDHLQRTYEDLIRNSGGEVVTSLVEATVLICAWRSSKEFIDASTAGDEVGNLKWLTHLIHWNRWTDPMSWLLHYPQPKEGVPGFKQMKISVSNYQGEARVWLEDLVRALGATFTKSMAQDTTHLITAHTHSDKCDAAREWNIDMVNHLWLEESYAAGEMQPLSRGKYITWPARSNLGEVIGRTHIDRDAIAKVYLPRPILSSPVKAGMDEKTDAGDEDDAAEAVDARDEADASEGADAPVDAGASTKHEPNPSAAKTPAASSAKKRRKVQTPAQRLSLPEATSSSRRAKDRALSKLQGLAPDIALYQKESKRVGGVIYGGRRVDDPDRINVDIKSYNSSRKRSVSEGASAAEGTRSQADSDSETPAKRQKKSKAITREPLLKLLATGLSDVEGHEQKLKGLNLRFVDHGPVDVIVTPGLKRTKKMLCGMTHCPVVVGPAWLTTMAKKGARVSTEGFALQDPEGEQLLGHKLEDIMARAQQNRARGGMLRGWTILCTDHASAGFDTVKEIIVANGGRCLLFRGRPTKLPAPKPSADSNEDMEMADEADKENADQRETKPRLFMISDVSDKKLWQSFRKMADDDGYEPCIVQPDWLFRIAIVQDTKEWKDEWRY